MDGETFVGLVLLGLGLVAWGLGLLRAARHPGTASSLVGLLATSGLAVLAGLVGLALPRRYVVVGADPTFASAQVTGTGLDLSALACAPGQLGDVALVVVGLLLAVGCAGFAVGRRRSRRAGPGA